MQLCPGVIRTGEAIGAEAAGGHAEVTAILPHHDIGGQFRNPEEGVFALVDRQVFRDAVLGRSPYTLFVDM